MLYFAYICLLWALILVKKYYHHHLPLLVVREKYSCWKDETKTTYHGNDYCRCQLLLLPERESMPMPFGGQMGLYIHSDLQTQRSVSLWKWDRFCSSLDAHCRIIINLAGKAFVYYTQGSVVLSTLTYSCWGSNLSLKILCENYCFALTWN